MNLRKNFFARTAAFILLVISSFILPQNVHASGYPVFDLTAMMNAIQQIYQTYDEINSMIEQVENGYKQIEQGINMVKSFNFEEMSLEDWSSEGGLKGAWENIGKSRTRLRQAGGYVSQKQEEMAAIKKKLNSNIISWNGTNYSIEDLVGMGGESKSIFGLAANMADYAMDRYETAASGWAEGLSENERRNIWKYYGVSPEVFKMGECVSGLTEGLIEGSLGTLTKDFDSAYDAQTEAELQEALAIGDAADGTDSTVTHLQHVQDTEMRVYKGIRDMNKDLKLLLGVLAEKEYREKYEEQVQLRKKRQNDVNNWMENRRDSDMKRKPGGVNPL